MHADWDSSVVVCCRLSHKYFDFRAQVTHLLNQEKQKARQNKTDKHQVGCQLAPVSCQMGTHLNETYVDCTGPEYIDVK